jgi:hypothetical protein
MISSLEQPWVGERRQLERLLGEPLAGGWIDDATPLGIYR